MGLKLWPPGSRKGNRSWVIRGTVNGRDIEVSTKTTDKKAAERLKIDLEYKLSRSNFHRETITFADAARLYSEYRRPSKADQRRIDRLVRFLGQRRLATFQSADLVEAAAVLYPRYSPESKNRSVFAVGAAVLHYAAENELCEWKRIKKMKERRPEARAVSKEVAAALMGSARGPLRLLLTWLFRQGWRISDALNARYEHVDLERRLVRYHVGKTDEWLTVPLHDDVVALWPKEAPSFGWIFPWRERSTANKHLKRLCKQLGVKFTFHQARHSFGTWLVNEGATMNELMEAGNWRDPKSVVRYGRVSQDRVRQIIHRVKG